MLQPIDDDSTVRLVKPVSAGVKSRRFPVWALVAPVLLVLFAAPGIWLLWPRPPTPALVATPPVAAPPLPGASPAPVVVPPLAIAPPSVPVPAPAEVRPPETTAATIAPPVAQAAPGTQAIGDAARSFTGRPGFRIETATEQQILDHVPVSGAPDPTVFRFRPNPQILVLDFASLRDQGRMLNRVAALVEKKGLPRDRLLNDGELDSAIRASGDTVETFYYGHDYGAPELIRFFALAARDNVRLVTEEDRLAQLLHQGGWFEPNTHAALISIPQVGADQHVTRAARATILHHELSHGEYFTNPEYAAVTHRFWTQTLTPAERDRIRRRLRALGYDSSLDEVMENEAQAYLMFTDGAEFFTPGMIGMSRARLTDLRNGFVRAMPSGWLRDSLGQFINASRTAASPRP